MPGIKCCINDACHVSDVGIEKVVKGLVVHEHPELETARRMKVPGPCSF